jgi:peptidoglycan hydrolase CwlO-like protein
MMVCAPILAFSQESVAASPAAAADGTTTTATEPSLVPTAPQPPDGSATASSGASSLDSAASGLGMSLKSLDFGEAQLSLAGPSALYIRSVKVEGAKVSLLFRKGEQDQWKLVEMIPEDKNFFPQGLVLDFARLSKLEDGSLEIDGIVLDGRPYRTVVTLNDDNSLSFNQPLQAGTFVGASVGRARPTAELALKDDIAKLNEAARVNQDTLSRIGSLEGSNRTLGEEKAKLEDQLKELDSRKTALDAEIVSLKSEIETLKADKAKVDAFVAQGQAAGTETSAGPATSNAGSQDDRVARSLDSLMGAVEKLAAKVDALDGRLNTLSSRTADVVPGPTASGDLGALQAEVKRLSDLNQQLMNERQAIEQKLRAEYVASGYIQIIKPLMKQVVLSGFATAKSKIGSWKVTPAKAVQPDPGQFFAQLNLPLVQKNSAMLYKFDAKSTGKGWVGLGLHIYAQDSEKRGYGHGKSLLVWLTRDPDYYKNNRTYLQLYKSDDDINMGRVLDSAIQESISDKLQIEVLYQPVEEYLTVSVNGVEKIRYKTWFGINSGVEVALRSLDSAEFTNLEVRTADGK